MKIICQKLHVGLRDYYKLTAVICFKFTKLISSSGSVKQNSLSTLTEKEKTDQRKQTCDKF